MTGVMPGVVGLMCGEQDIANPVLMMGTQMSVILLFAQIFQFLLKPLGQPGTIAHILAGLVLGPSILSRIKTVQEFFLEKSASIYYQMAALLARIVFIFMVGLQIDIPATIRNLRRSNVVAISAGLISSIFALAISPYLYSETQVQTSGTNIALFPFFVMLIIANTASPVVNRLAAELKLSSTNVGQLAISSSLINDLGCLFMLTIYILFAPNDKDEPQHILGSFLAVVLIGAGFVVFTFIVWVYKKRNRDKKYMTSSEILIILVFLITFGVGIEAVGQNSMIPCFACGLMVPREGKVSRTLLRKFTFGINIFVLPIYFGYTGFQADLLSLFKEPNTNWDAAAVVVLVTMGSRIGGALAACHYYLKTPLNEGVVLALLLNLKGFVDLQIIGIIVQSDQAKTWGPQAYNLFISSLVINTLIGGSVAAYIVNKDAKSFGYNHKPLAFQKDINSDLRILACVHDARHATAITGLIAMMTRCSQAPVTPYLIHLLQLHERARKGLTFHQLDDYGEFFKEVHDYGGQDVLVINHAIDTFMVETKVTMRSDKIVSIFPTMYKEVCDKAEEFNASVILLSFHKHQRIDGKMESVKKEGFRMTNQKILRHSPCTVAILVNKGSVGSAQVLNADAMQHVAVLFFGGNDDRETLAFSTRIGLHPHVNMTIIRFQHPTLKNGDNPDPDKTIDDGAISHDEDDNNDLTVISNTSENEEKEVDNVYVSDFYNRYVTTGEIGFVEKYVENGAETVSALRDMGDMYSLFIVGKGGRGNSPITMGMSDWEECPELGKIGDLLASSDFDIRGSVLVIQQHRHSENEHVY